MGEQSRYGTHGSVGKRYYDPEDRRQRRVGQAQAIAGAGGAGAAGFGAKGIADDTKKLRQKSGTSEKGAATNRATLRRLAENAPEGKKPYIADLKPVLDSADRKGLLKVTPKNAALLAGGAAGLGAASQITRHVSSSRGRGWN